MKTIYRYFMYLCMLVVPMSVQAGDLGALRLSLIEGDVQVLVQDTTEWTPAAINLPMNEHDRLWAPDGSRAELHIRGGVYARVDENTGLDILTLTPDSAQFYLDRGHVYISDRSGGMNTVQVDTPMASIRGYDNSVMMIDVSEDGVNEISVLRGAAYAESKAGATRISAGNTLTILGEGNARISPINSPDEWEQWNMDRDKEVFTWTESSRYLPEELQEYSSDLDRNGRWDYIADYGYAWFPAVTVSNWAPYSYGNWVWVRGNYVWIDYHSWGWAPSHYGRWVFIEYRGWCWVPPAIGAAYWAPGYVGWIVTPSYVAWVPLAPGEIYYGYGYYGPGSVNIATVNINTVVVNRRYRNAGINDSVTVVKRDTFGTGRRDPVRIQENPFESRARSRHNVNIVPPRVRPERPVVIAPPEARETSRTARERRGLTGRQGRIIGETPPARSGIPDEIQRREQPVAPPRVTQGRQQPPERILRNRPQNMKNQRPMVRQPEASVFRPQPPDDMPVTKSRQPRVINRRPAPGPVQQQQSGAINQTPSRGPASGQERQESERQPQRSLQERRHGR